MAIDRAAAYNFQMHIFWVLLMMALLPLPFFAAASVVSGAQPSALHSRHHLPAEAQAAEATQDVLTAASGLDVECGTCQPPCAGATLTPLVLGAGPDGTVPTQYRAQRMQPHRAEQPYRPNWPTPHGSGLSTFS